ncbi:MAG: SoxR reducing system RseC family protein [Holophaga sp.]|nr:SoxR reducing system RseC family protein [Holophaga sp.]
MKGVVLPLNERGLYPIELDTQGGGCEGCSAKGICKIPATDLMEIAPEHLPSDIHPGDNVEVELSPAVRVWLSFSTFILPLLTMLAGALVGAIRSERWAMASGFAGLFLGLLANWALNRSLSAQKRIQIKRC